MVERFRVPVEMDADLAKWLDDRKALHESKRMHVNRALREYISNHPELSTMGKSGKLPFQKSQKTLKAKGSPKAAGVS